MNPEAIKAAALAWERGRNLMKEGKHREAEPHLRAALKVMPNSAALLADYGRLAELLGDWRAAATLWQRVAKADPTRETGNRVGLALLQLGQNAEALPWLERYLARHPDDTDSVINLAAANSRLQREEMAIAILRQSLARNPQQQQAWETLVTLLINTVDPEGAEAALGAALTHFPASPELRYLLMDHRLKRGEFAAGFDLFDARWGTRYFSGTTLPAAAPRWDGRPFEGRLLVRAEQGLGDELLYSSLFGDVARVHTNALVECEPRLEPLYARSFPGLSFIPRTVPDNDPRKAGFTREILAGDLCRLFRRAPADFPERDRWLTPDPGRVAALRADYTARFGNTLRVGLSWRSRNPAVGAAKSLTLESLLPILRVPGVSFINLQYGDTAEEIAALRTRHGIAIHNDPAIDPMRDIDGQAAQLCALDLLVSTSNSTVHLAGALGVPVWLMLHRDYGLPWYWGYAGNRSHWYPALRILRCARRGEWEPLVADVAGRLAALAGQAPGTAGDPRHAGL